MSAPEAFHDAEVMADFANLEPTDLASIARFRKNYPDFAPSAWWDYPYRIDGNRFFRYEDIINISPGDPHFETKMAAKIRLQWQHTQEQVQEAWFHFKDISTVSGLLKLVFFVDRPGSLIWNSSQVLVPHVGIVELKSNKLYSFHKAVLYLHEHPQQAKTCDECEKYFVHPHGKRTHCLFVDSEGRTCAQETIRRDHLKHYHRKGAKRRRAKRKQEKLKAAKKTTAR